MSAIDFLVFSLALIPALLAVHVWWYVTYIGEDLSGICAAYPHRFKD